MAPHALIRYAQLEGDHIRIGDDSTKNTQQPKAEGLFAGCGYFSGHNSYQSMCKGRGHLFVLVGFLIVQLLFQEGIESSKVSDLLFRSTQFLRDLFQFPVKLLFVYQVHEEVVVEHLGDLGKQVRVETLALKDRIHVLPGSSDPFREFRYREVGRFEYCSYLLSYVKHPLQTWGKAPPIRNKYVA